MEVDLGGFSIREYALKMRSVDAVNCWPFSVDITGDRVRSLLPPITVSRFRWWSRELSLLRPAAAAEEESDRPRRRAKAKPRPPKKRSIVEIFAAAPKVQRAEREDDGDSSDSRLIDLKRKRRKKKKKKQEVLKREKKNYPIDAKTANKVINKRKEETQAPLHVEMDDDDNDDVQCSLGSMEETSDVKAGILCSSCSEEGRFSCCTESVVKDLDPGFQVRSILKTERKVYTLKNPDKLNLRKKHVRFSDQNDILSQRKKTVASLELSFCSLELDASSLSSCEDHQHSANDREFRHELSGIQFTNPLEKVDLLSFLPHITSQERIKHGSGKPLHPSELGINPDTAKAADVCIPVTTPISNSSWKAADFQAEVAPHFCFPFTSTSNENVNRRNYCLYQPAPGDMHQYWSSCHQFPVEWMQESVVCRERQAEEAFLGFPLNLQGELVSADGFCPRGDHRQLSSCCGAASPKTLSAETKLLSGNVDFSNMEKNATGKAHANDGLALFPVRNQNRLKYFPARLGVDETFSEKADVSSSINHREISQSVRSPGSNLSLKSSWIELSSWNDLIKNNKGESTTEIQGDMPFYNTPATMRLMGKDVTVGTSSSDMQMSGAGKVRTNEGIIAQNTPFATHLDGSLLGSHTQLGWPWLSTRGNPQNSLRIPLDNNMRNPAFQGDSSKDDSFHWFCEPHLNLDDAQATTSVIPDQRFHLDASYSMLGSDLSFQGSGSSQPNSFTRNPRLPFPCNPQIAGSHFVYSNVGTDLNHVDPHAGKPPFRFPFLCTDATGQSIMPHFHQSSLKSPTPSWSEQRVQWAKTTVALQTSSHVSGRFFTSETGPGCLLMDGSAPQISLSSTQQPLAFSGFKSSPFTSVGRTNRTKGRGRVSAKASSAREEDGIGRISKRQAEFPRKKNHRIKKGGWGSMKELAAQNMNSERRCDKGEGGGGGDHRHAQSEHVVEAASTGQTAAGPFKLSAGTMYVLTPSQDMIQIPQDRLTH